MSALKKAAAVILAVLQCALLLCLSVFAEDTQVAAEPEVTNCAAAYLYNFENDKAVYSYKADEKVSPTSSVKIMTGILAVEALGAEPDRQITVTAEMLSNVAGNNISLKAGETVTVKDMIHTLLVNGANDSAYVIAYTVSGSAGAFVSRMNTRARELGAYNTNYANPTGMHDASMYTTAQDTAIIARHAYSLDMFMECATSIKYSMPQTNKSQARTVYNRNCLMSVYYEQNYFYDKAKGINAGSTSEGGYCVVTTATDGKLTYLAVVLGAKSVEGKIYSYVDATNMLEWGFAAFTYKDVLSPDQVVCEIPVTLSTAVDHVTLVSKETLSVFLPSDTNVEEEITVSYVMNSDSLQAPVSEGQVAGKVTAVYKGEVLGSTDLIATADVSRSDMLYGLYRIQQFTKSRFFIATLVAAVVFFLLYIFGTAYFRQKRFNRTGRY